MMWLAGLVIFLHAVIPHHHHYTSDYSCFANSSQREVLVTHVDHNCHAFNELIREDRTSSATKSHKQINHSCTFALAFTLPDEVKEEGAVSLLSFGVVPDDDCHLRDNHPVRGSPIV